MRELLWFNKINGAKLQKNNPFVALKTAILQAYQDFMKNFIVSLFFSLGTISVFAKKPTQLERPKLVVGIVVDQMRWDYLYRFYDRFSDNGFKRLMNEGFNCEQTFINYLPAYTAPGHSCIYTGSIPSIHGIAGNDWINKQNNKSVYCTEDKTVLPVGGSWKAGQMSPANLLASTITDELRLATNFKSKIFGFSIKDRGAIIPAGHLANGAFWYDDSTGNLMSSNYYGNALPQWLQEFNNKKFPEQWLRFGWTLSKEDSTYVQSLPDSNGYEGNFFGESKPIFPHLKAQGKNLSNLRKIPAGNSFILDASKECINAEHLGIENRTDFLCVSLSSTDYIGHQFAPNSVEIEDTYIKLDKDLEGFLSFLDKTVGKNQYLIMLTADHGGAHNAKFLNDIKIPAGNENEANLLTTLKAELLQKFASDSLILGWENYQIFLNELQIEKKKVNRSELIAAIKNFFNALPQVAYVIDMEHIDETPTPEPIKSMIVNGYNRLRSGQIQVIFNPGWYLGYSETGTTHGTWHPYDTHIPLLWYGWKIKSGSSNKINYMTDIAATFAALLHIQMPNGNIGKPIEALMQK